MAELEDAETVEMPLGEGKKEVFENDAEENKAGFHKLMGLMKGGMHRVHGDIDLILKIVETLLSRTDVSEQVMFIENGIFPSLFPVINWAKGALLTKGWKDDVHKQSMAWVIVEKALKLCVHLSRKAISIDIVPVKDLFKLCCDILFTKEGRKLFRGRKNFHYYSFRLLCNVFRSRPIINGVVHDDKEDRVGDILGYLKAYNTHTKLSVLILYCVCMMLQGNNLQAKVLVCEKQGLDLIIDTMFNDSQGVILYGSYALMYLTASYFEGIELVCEYESAEDYPLTKMFVKFLGIFKQSSQMHKSIQVNILSILVSMHKSPKGKGIFFTGMDEGLVRWTMNSVREYPDYRLIQKLGCWLLSILVTLTQNKDMFPKGSDSEYSSEEEDRIPQALLSEDQEKRLAKELTRENTNRMCTRLMKFITNVEKKIAVEEKQEEEERKREAEEEKQGGGEVDDLFGSKEEVPAPVKVYLKKTTKLDPEFKPIVNITMRSVEWYESYLDAMKLAKEVVEKEEKAAAEELKKSLEEK